MNPTILVMITGLLAITATMFRLYKNSQIIYGKSSSDKIPTVYKLQEGSDNWLIYQLMNPGLSERTLIYEHFSKLLSNKFKVQTKRSGQMYGLLTYDELYAAKEQMIEDMMNSKTIILDADQRWH